MSIDNRKRKCDCSTAGGGCFLVLLGAAIWTFAGGALAGESPDPGLPYQAERSNPVTYDVDFSAVVTPPYGCKLLHIWLPLPQTDAGQEVTEGSVSTFPAEVQPHLGAEPVFGNRFAYFEFQQPQGAQVVRHQFQVKVWQLNWNLDPRRVESVTNWPDGFAPFLRGEQQAVVVDDRIRELSTQIVPQRRGELNDLQAVMQWAEDHLTYDHDNASLAASAVHMFEKRRGHCSDYHGFCAALGRALGYPTRVTYGINPFPRNSPSHCKLESYIPPYGWVSFDVSETQRLVAAIKADGTLDEPQRARLVAAATHRFQRGFRDNTWFLQTRGTDYDLAPPAAHKVPVVRTIYAEADGVPLAEPDPGNKKSREFSWMTVHKYTPDKEVKYPFKDWSALLENER